MSHLKLKTDASRQIIFVQTYIQEDSEFKLLQLNKFLKKKLDSNIPILISGTFNELPSSSSIKKLEENFVDLYQPSEDEEFQAIGQSSKYPAFTMQSP